MKVSIDGLAGVDPRAVPLPHGTMVTTTVARAIEGTDRVVPQGAIGRVTALLPEGRVRVAVVGRGELVYARSELVPRKVGEVRQAVRRAATEAALGRCAVLRSIVGSRAWGLSDDASDVDRRGVFLFPFPWTARLEAPPDVIVSADGSATHWEIERTIRQLLRADPNTLEMLFVPEIEVLDPVGATLLEHRDAFVSQEIYGSFGRYALAQAKKLRQSLRLAEHRGKVLDWLRDEPSLELDDVAARLADATGVQERLEAKTYVKQLYRSLYDQGLLRANAFDALREFARSEAVELDLPRELRPKNAYNLLRTVSCAVQWLSTGVPLVAVEGELREQLLAIKRGEVPLSTSIAWTEAAAEGLDTARDSGVLPREPDFARAQQILFEARAEAARRFVTREPGPWGLTMWSALTDRQREVASRVLDEESSQREHIVVHVSGAHAYGFASPDSDVDLKAIHIEPTRKLLGLEPPAPTVDRLEVIEGVEIDYTSNELLTAVRGLVSGNGNMLERIASTDPARTSALVPELAALARHTLSRRYYRHYRGFAKSQREALAAEPTAKKALYVLRTTLTGTHLLETGECIPDLTQLYARYGFGITGNLLALKRSAEKQLLPDELQIALPTILDEAFARLDSALARSILPEDPDLARAEEVLLEIRGRA